MVLRSTGLPLIIGVLFGTPPWVAAMGFSCSNPKTLREVAVEADVIVYGTIANPGLVGWDGKQRLPEKAAVHIHQVIKGHRILKQRKVILFDCSSPIENPKRPRRYLLFFDVCNGKLAPCWDVDDCSPGIADYLKGAMALDQKDRPKALRYFSRYLETPDLEIARDAYLECSRARYQDLQGVAKTLTADRVLGWLQNPNTPRYRTGLYAQLLGHCGNGTHAAKLRKMLGERAIRMDCPFEGFLVGYTLLRPNEGWAYIREHILANRRAKFVVRYAGLRAMRFFWDHRPDVVARKALISGMCLLVGQDDMADLAIEDLRKWQVWEVSDKVLALANRQSHDIFVVRKALLRYALSCPAWQVEARDIVKAERKRDSDYVAEMEELLKLEQEEIESSFKSVLKVSS
jgi:hypothetical protein